MTGTPIALSPEQVAHLLAATQAGVAAEITALPEAVLSWHPAAGEWCVKETLGHLIEAERRGFNGRIREMLGADEPALASWDQQAVARARRDCERSGADLLREFQELRSDSVSLVKGLDAAALGRGGTHTVVGHLRIQDLLQEWVHHDRNHLRQMLANVQAYAWPHMANAQRFSAD